MMECPTCGHPMSPSTRFARGWEWECPVCGDRTFECEAHGTGDRYGFPCDNADHPNEDRD